MPKSKDELKNGMRQRFKDASTKKVNVFDFDSIVQVAQNIENLCFLVANEAPTDLAAENFIDAIEQAYKDLLLAMP